MKKFTSILFLAMFALVPLFAYAEKVQDLNATDYVNDFAGVLTAEQKQELSNELGNLEKSTGDQVAVAIVKKMEDESGRSDYIEHFAVKLYEKWGMGKKGSDQNSDKGALFLVSIEDRQMRIEVGYGLEPTLTDGITKNILDNDVRPKFKNSDYFGGVKTGVDDIASVLNGGTLPESANNSLDTGNTDWFSIIVFLLVFGVNIFGWLFAIMARTKSWWLGGFASFILATPIFYFIFGLGLISFISILILTILGFLFDYLISKNYLYWQSKIPINGGRSGPAWWAGGGWGPGSGGFSGRGGSGFGGFGGGSSGGGGSSSSW